jgi:acetoin utilization deacetylase AcuC-like enzyme
MASTALVFNPFMQKHDPGGGHPERPARLAAILTQLQRAGTLDLLQQVEPRAATEDELALVHDRRYIDLVRREVESGYEQLSTGDTMISAASLDCAKLAAGSVLTAVDTVVASKSQNAFCPVRPPGHHAESARGMGFCLFNNVAVGARYAQNRYGISRVLIVDWDVHHGNGTQQIFYADPSVYFFSTHQSPWYPGTGAASERGAGPGEGTTRNCPLSAGSGRVQIFGAFRNFLLPEAREFRPELILISAGFDSRVNDPLGQFTLEDDDFGELTRWMLALAAETAQGRLISVLEGGYNLPGLASAADAHIRALAGIQ